MAEIRWTREAEKWLHDIYDYIALDSHKAARQVVEGIYQKAQILKRFPKIGHRYDRCQDENIRILLYGHYRIAYIIKSNENIDILGVFHGALDMDRYFSASF